MMHEASPLFKFDNASAISQGGREYQQDAIVSDFSNGADICFAVLSDGMGGHAAGDVASKIVVTEIFSELTFQRNKIAQDPSLLAGLLQDAVLSANACLKSHMTAHPETNGMGATLVACIVIEDKLYWISIGDSPLFLFRDNVLYQLNEDHSLGPHIDLMVQSGVMTPEQGAHHPERNVLTSVLAGQTKVAQIDCPAKPFTLQAGDTIIVASDGLQYLTNDEISQILRHRPMARSADIADALMAKLTDLNDPDLDNVSLSLIQVCAPMHDSKVHYPTFRTTAASDRKQLWPFGRRNVSANAAHGETAAPIETQGGAADRV